MGIFLPAIEMADHLCLMPTASLAGTIADNHKQLIGFRCKDSVFF